jgi:hypothetical protein
MKEGLVQKGVQETSFRRAKMQKARIYVSAGAYAGLHQKTFMRIRPLTISHLRGFYRTLIELI